MGQYTAWADGIFKQINNKESKRLRSDSENKECFVPLITLCSASVHCSQHNDLKHNKTIYSFKQTALFCNKIICHRHNIIPLEVICLPHTIPNAIWKLEAQFLNFLQEDNTGLFLVRYCRKTGILWTANWNNVKKLKYFAIFIINPWSSTF